MKAKFLMVALAAVTMAIGAAEAQPPRDGKPGECKCKCEECKCPQCKCPECRCKCDGPDCRIPARRVDEPRPESMTAEQMAQRMTDHMTRQLGLTPEQASQVYPLCLDQAKRVIKDREDRKAGVEPKAKDPEKMQKMREKHVAKMQKILTPEQFTEWMQAPAPKDRPHHKARRGEMAPRGHADRPAPDRGPEHRGHRHGPEDHPRP